MLNEAFRRGGKLSLRLSASGNLDKGCVYDGFLHHAICSQSRRITHLSLLVHWEAFGEFLALRFLQSFKLGLCWPQLTHINFGDILIQLSIAHELMKLCTSLHAYRIFFMTDVSPKVVFSAASIGLPHRRGPVVQEAGPERNTVLAKFIWPLVLPALQNFRFSLLERTSLTDIAPLTELASIVDSWSLGPTLYAELYYRGTHLTEVAGHLPFLSSIHAYRSVLFASGR